MAEPLRLEIEAIEARSVKAELVIELSRRHQGSLGMMPFEGFHSAAERGFIVGAFDGETLAGYVMFRVRKRPPAVMLHHLCVAESYARRGVARRLVDDVARRFESQPGIGAWCRTDYPAHKAWPKLGFSRTAEKPGRGRLGLPLAHWWRPIAEHNLFTFDRDTANLPAAALDTDVFRDCYEPRLKYPESSGLLAGWLADQVELVVTGQLSTELHEASGLRPDVRSAVEQFRRLAAPTERWEPLAALVRAEVHGSFGEGDVRHLAQAAAGGATYFVTRDEDVLVCAQRLNELVGLRVLTPADLLLALHDASNDGSYRPAALAETALSIRRLREVPEAFDLQRVTDHASGETTGALVNLVRDTAARLDAAGRVLVIEDEHDGVLALSAVFFEGGRLQASIRARSDRRQTTLVRQLAHELREYAVAVEAQGVDVLRPFPSYLATPLMDEGFELTGTGLSADCCVGHFSVMALPPARTGWDGSQLPAVGVSELERRFRPGKFVTGDTPVYVVPIRPKWAESLFGAAVQPELSRRPEHLGVAREHVYYCALRTNLKVPSRLLWYVSGTGFNGGIRATSWLDAVVVDRPRTLHRRFGLNGVYTASEVESIIKKPGGRATAMVFSRTEVLGRSVPIKELKALDPRFNVLRSTRELDEHVFVEILERGAT